MLPRMVYLTKSQRDSGALFLALPCRYCGCGIAARTRPFKIEKDAEGKDAHYKKTACRALKDEREAEEAGARAGAGAATATAAASAPVQSTSTKKALHRCGMLEESVRPLQCGASWSERRSS